MLARCLVAWLGLTLGCAPPATTDGSTPPTTPPGAKASAAPVVVSAPMDPASAPPTWISQTLALDTALQPEASLSQAQAEHDVRVLQEALHQAWGGFEFVDPQRLAEVEQRLEALPGTLRPRSSEALCDGLAELLAPLPDAHLAVSLEGKRACGRSEHRPPSVGPNVAADRSKPWRWTQREVGTKTVGVLALPRFFPSSSPGWDGMLDTIDAAEVAAMVIDMRGNSGGDDTAAYWIAQAITGTLIRRPGVTIVRSQHPLAITLMMNAVMLQMRRHQARDGSVPEHLRTLHHQMHALRDAVVEGEAPKRVEFTPGPDAPLPRSFRGYEGPVLVLVDAACGSSCENALTVFREIPNAVVVGESTAGAIHFGQAGRLVLPHSHAIVIIATQFNRYADGTFREKLGFAPQVVVPPGQDALQVALDRLR